VRLRTGRILPWVFLGLALAASAIAQAPRAVPVSGKIGRFAVSQNVRDLPSAPPDDSTLPAEWIRDNDRLPRSKGPFPGGARADAVLQRPVTTPNMPGPSAAFAGISADDAAGVAGRFAPPDTVGDVGPNHFVQAVNTVVRVFDKSGNPLSNLVSLGTFFNPLGSGCNGQFGDPIVLYDSLADRWLISQFGLPSGFQPPFHQCIGISQTPDPTGAFYLYDFVMPNKVNDYPHFGVWPDAYYMSDNQFAIGGASYAGAGFLAFDRAKMLVGDQTATYIYFDYFAIDPNAGGMLPSDVDGLTAPPPGTPNLFFEFRADEFGDPFDALRLYEFHADFATPGNSTLTVRPDLAVAAFDARSPNSRATVEQPSPAGSSDYVDAIADRMMFRVAYRTLAGGVQSFACNWTVNVSGVNPTGASTYQAGIRFTELRRDAGTGDVTIQNQVTYAPGAGNGATGRNVWMGSAAQDYQGNSAVGFSASSTTLFPSLLWAGRLAGDPADTLNQGEAMVFAGVGSQLGSGNRWGDYSALTVDPSDDCTFFYTQEYYANSNSFDWATRVATFAYPGCTAAPRGSVSGTVTVCGSGLPLAGAVVSDGLGHVRVTDAAGAYTMDLSPGSYTLTISKANFTTGGGPVVVTDGVTTSFDVCLTGVPAFVAASAALTAESCLPPNGALDPGETVTVSFCIQNNGGADTADLVATLGASGGVIDPPGPVDFGVVPAGGAAVCRDVTFTADPALACGATVTASLSLQDGASSLGSVATDFQTGLANGVFAQAFDGVVAPALPTGWVANNASGGAPAWVTSTSAPDTPANDAFVNDPAVVADKRLDSPAIPITTASARLAFRHSFNLENGFDGGVLEIAIGGGPFADVLAAGGSFVSGGYTATLDGTSGNPLAGRPAWTGNSGGYVSTVVALPPSAAGTNVVLRWRMGSDIGMGGVGWRVDTITLSDGFLCCSSPAATALAVDIHPAAPAANLNGVWEPGETVAVEPSYQNNSTLGALTLSGTASNLTGPAGAAYAIADGTANYGTLATGATATCADAGDCYAMSVDNPATRPAAHWDATFDELLSTGRSRAWTLHIGASFGDVPTAHPFYAFIENIFHNGITGGCAAGAYCPGNDVTRAQMAVFILKAEHGAAFAPPACTGLFTDVACPSQFADWIERLAAEGITSGCGGTNYCPTNPVTRAQMAVFLLKGKHGSSHVPPGCMGIFTDVTCPGAFAVDWIEELFNEGITSGCGAGIYCPSSPNTRGQMAVFLTKAFGLLLYGP
jgi:hypothetical protein